MTAHGEILSPASWGARRSRSRSVARRRVLGPLTVALVGTSAWATATLAATPLVQQEVRLTAVITPSAMQGNCAAGWKMMSVPEVLRMIDPPATADDVRATDANRDNYLCASLSTNGFRVTRYVDNVRRSGGSGCSGGMDANGMPTGCNGNGMNGDKNKQHQGKPKDNNKHDSHSNEPTNGQG
jgi:hypothetical protein